jgi:class 3 adenylate cyclase
MGALFAATYPERTTALILCGTSARLLEAPDYPIGTNPKRFEAFIARTREAWGKGLSAELFAPSLAGDERFRQSWARFERFAVSPAGFESLMRMAYETDVRHVLPAIRVPTLVLHRTGDRPVPVARGRYLAQRIAGARYVELPGDDHFPWVGDVEALVSEVEEFLTGTRHLPETERVLATVLFTDVVGSTQRAAEVGDRRWRDVLEGYLGIVRRQLVQFRGREIDTAGDGVFATFDGPARAIRCASAITTGVRPLGIEVRTGLHTGECEVMGDKVGGIAVHIGARVSAAAGPGEVLVSSTVKDLVAGSRIAFEDRGMHVLKGVSGEWPLFRVVAPC